MIEDFKHVAALREIRAVEEREAEQRRTREAHEERMQLRVREVLMAAMVETHPDLPVRVISDVIDALHENFEFTERG